MNDIKQLKEQAEIGRAMYRNNLISRTEAQELIMPYIDKVNERSKELAKKYNQKPKLTSFSAYLR